MGFAAFSLADTITLTPAVALEHLDAGHFNMRIGRADATQADPSPDVRIPDQEGPATRLIKNFAAMRADRIAQMQCSVSCSRSGARVGCNVNAQRRGCVRLAHVWQNHAS
jgi:Peroxidase